MNKSKLGGSRGPRHCVAAQLCAVCLPARVRAICPALLCAVAAAGLAVNVYAVETKFWQQTDQADFEKGSFENVSLRSDGRLFLAPAQREVFDSSVPYLWSAASDSKGNLFVGGGGSGSGRSKLFEIGRDGKTKTLVELDGLEIHAIAVDAHDQIYAGTDPDGKIYKISPDGKCQTFFDPQAKYIWAMAFDSSGNLFVATGDQGDIYKVTPEGKGAVFFRTEETHARSLAIDSNNNLIVGTEPNGLILRISPTGAGFVLDQARKREITAVALGPDGAIYAAGVGTRSTAPVVPAAPVPTPSPMASSHGGAAGTIQVAPRGPGANPPASFTPAAVTGGSDLYRIDADGSPHRIWSNNQDIVYAISFGSDGLPLLGTGNGGRVFRVDSDILSTQLMNLPPTQATAFAKTSDGRLFVITGNIGKVYQIGPGTARTGTFESDALDAGSFAYWGRLSVHGSESGISVRTRSGNLNRPVNNWSPWLPLSLQQTNGELSARVGSPSARFLQYELMLASGNGPSPHVSSVDIAYLTKNVAPTVEAIDITPPNYRLPSQSLTITPSTSLTLPPMGQKRVTSNQPPLDLGIAETLNYAKGYLGARWMARDDNGDTLTYKVEIRGHGETEWKLLKDKLREKSLSFDSTAFPDGQYELRVTASDAPSNPPGQALTASLISDPFLIDNTPPQISDLAATPRGNRIELHWRAHDSASIIDHAEYSINGGDWLVAEPVTRLSDSQTEEYRIVLDRVPGEATLAVRVTDDYDNQAVGKVVVK